MNNIHEKDWTSENWGGHSGMNSIEPDEEGKGNADTSEDTGNTTGKGSTEDRV
ncbi:hypothetical protein CHISP_0192 [Chitinispirillum alkaliphilum]|nr:hypothetical protein CHISP_0192 [Chitinispirillum alkaliphilum]